VAVALGFVAQRPDHLRVAVVAALAHVDVAAGQFQRRIGPHARHRLDRALGLEDQRHDLDEAADGHDHQRSADGQQDRVLLENFLV
jgi:hypothetical protein